MKKMKLITLFVLLSFTLSAQYAPSFGSNQVIQYSHFMLSYNEQHEQPEWVYYRLTKTDLDRVKIPRANNFRPDTSILTGSATNDDYIGTGFDRGHLSPAYDNQDELSNSESFLMSNMSPQLPPFNRGIWVDLERWVRKQAMAYDTIYVTTGPIFINNLGHAGRVTIPGYYYKCLLRFYKGKAYTIAFLLPHVGAVGNVTDYIVPVNTIETLTGINFFPALSESAENMLLLKRWK